MKKIYLVILMFMFSVMAASANDLQVKSVGVSWDTSPKNVQPLGPRHEENHANESEVVFEGVVLERPYGPGIWPGILDTYQTVKFEVKKVISGPVEEKQVDVIFSLASPLTEKGSPEVSKTLFKVGNKLKIRAMKTADGEYHSLNRLEDAVLI